ncbi:MAG: type II toxin-antitoxin system VapB family antitoxin [Turneriella sp.]
MRTTIEIDDGKIKAAQLLYANLNKTELVDLALSELIRLGKNRQLARLAGKFPELREVPRRKF